MSVAGIRERSALWLLAVPMAVLAVSCVYPLFFALNNSLTYADKRLKGAGPLLRGWLKFAATCSVGLLANVGVAAVLVRLGVHPYPAALSGIVVGSVWNYALSSRFVWGRFG